MKKVYITPVGLFSAESKKEVSEFIVARYPGVKLKDISVSDNKNNEPVIDIDQLINPRLKPSLIAKTNETPLSTVIIQDNGRYIGIVVKDIVDLKTAFGNIEKNMTKQFGLMGCYIIDNEVVSLIDLNEILSVDANFLPVTDEGFARSEKHAA